MVSTAHRGDRIRLTAASRNDLARTSATRWARVHDYTEAESTVSEQHFTPDMTVDQAFNMHAGARRVFARFHLGGCSNCAISETETIGADQRRLRHPAADAAGEPQRAVRSRHARGRRPVRIPDEIRTKIPQLADVPEIGEITGVETAPTRPSSATCASKDWPRTSSRSRQAHRLDAGANQRRSRGEAFVECRASRPRPARRSSSKDTSARRLGSTESRSSPRSMSLTMQPSDSIRWISRWISSLEFAEARRRKRRTRAGQPWLRRGGRRRAARDRSRAADREFAALRNSSSTSGVELRDEGVGPLG